MSAEMGDRARGRAGAGEAWLPAPVSAYFASRGWTPFAYQEQAWRAYLDADGVGGAGGLIHAPTGVGKTMAAFLGPVIERLLRPPEVASADEAPAPARGTGTRRRAVSAGVFDPLTVLWVTPLRALASDTASSLEEAVRGVNRHAGRGGREGGGGGGGVPWSVQMRTGDTPQSVRAKQKERLPSVLVTTPESLTLLLSYPDARERFTRLRCVVADEWHELMASKRGVQLELALARLRRWTPGLRTWGVSATLGNLEQALDVLLGAGSSARGVLIRGDMPKALDIATLIPPDIERFPWAGHLGIKLVDAVAAAVDERRSTLLFTNTRSQAEIWFGRLLQEREDLVGAMAIHHGSLDRGIRAEVEKLLAAGRLRCVVCTSSLDLGVDFQPVDQVLQLGSPKGVARLLQRAGRSGHKPGATSRVLGVPTSAMELIEFAAARDAALAGRVESRPPIERPLDVLVQHLVTIACAGGFVEDDLKREVRSTYAFARLDDDDWDWCMDFVRRGGSALRAYPQYARVVERDGHWVVASDRAARAHRMTIGTITGETSLAVKYTSGKTLGNIEEGFLTKIVPGDRFVFAGRVLELVRVRDNTVFVRKTNRRTGIVPRWDGGRFSLSTQLADAVRDRLDQARRGIYDGPEMESLRPLLEVQARWSALPGPDELLVEQIATRDAFNLMLYPFAGRTVHEGLGALLAHRLTQVSPRTVTSSVSDYGICLASNEPVKADEALLRRLLSPERLVDDLVVCINAGLLARRQFRDIARIAGLVTHGFPGQRTPARHLQASSEMFFDVFEEFDPGNRLLEQSRREVMERQLDVTRLQGALERAGRSTLRITRPAQLTPMAFPIWAERLRANTLSSEKFEQMIGRMVVELEARAAGAAPSDAAEKSVDLPSPTAREDGVAGAGGRTRTRGRRGRRALGR